MQLDALHLFRELREIVAERTAEPIDAFDFDFPAAASDFLDMKVEVTVTAEQTP